MQIRGDISYWTPAVPEKQDVPLDTDNPLELPYSQEWFFLPEGLTLPPESEQLAAIRAHCIDYPEGVLLDVYQQVTSLSLDPRYQAKTIPAQRRFLDGLRDEVSELSQELKIAQYSHPYEHIWRAMEEDEDVWLHSVLPQHRLQFFQLEPKRKEHFLSEAGDVLWYASRVAAEMDTSLSRCFFEFLYSIDAGTLRELVDYHGREAFYDRFAHSMDFNLVQNISLTLADKVKVTLNRDIPGLRHDFSVEDNPIGWLDALADRELWPDGVAVKEDWDPDQPYAHLPDMKVALGKLVWFTAYTSHTILNTDFQTVMKANLQKNVVRSKHKTVLEKTERTAQDEAPITGPPTGRMPMES